MNPLENIDYPLLREQKTELLYQSRQFDEGTIADASISGIIHLIDAIQDYAVDTLGKSEEEVFGFSSHRKAVPQNKRKTPKKK